MRSKETKVFNVVPCNACTATGLKSYLCSGNAAGWSRMEGSSCSGERLGCLTEWKDQGPETGE